MKGRTYLLVVWILLSPAIVGGLLLLESALSQARAGQRSEVPGGFYIVLAWGVLGPWMASWLVERSARGIELKFDSSEQAARWARRLLTAASVYFGIAVLGLILFLVRYKSVTGGLHGLWYWSRGRRSQIPWGIVPEYGYVMLASMFWWFKAHDRLVTSTDFLAGSRVRSRVTSDAGD